MRQSAKYVERKSIQSWFWNLAYNFSSYSVCFWNQVLALYNELEEIIPLFLFSEFVKGQHYLCLEGLAELTLETTTWLP